MSAHTVITHALNQGVFPVRLVLVRAGEGALMEVDSREVGEWRSQGLDVAIMDVVEVAERTAPLAVDVPPHAQNQETHAFPTGMRARYTGSQSWGPAVVTVVKPWGGRVDPMYVVTVDGMDPKVTYVVAQSELVPMGAMGVVEVAERTAPLAVDVPPHVYSVGTAPARVNLVKTEGGYRACSLCAVGAPLYRVVWDTPGAWWGETHWERYCHSCLYGRGVSEGWAIPLTEGVSLRKPGEAVPQSAPVPTGPIREEGDGWVSYVPRAEWADLITAALRHSQYAYASALSEIFHAPESV